MSKMVNVMFCVFSHSRKWKQMINKQKKEEYCLGDAFSILNSVIFRKYRCLNPSTADYDSVHLVNGYMWPGM